MNRNKKIGLLLVLLLVVGVTYGGFKLTGPSYSLTMDVNPSIEIISNRFDRVVEVNPLNDDAREMLKDFEIKDKDLARTIEDLADLMVLTGYISGGEDNLVSIRVSDGDASEEVLNKLNEAIAAYLQNKQIEATIVNEPIRGSEETTEAVESKEVVEVTEAVEVKEEAPAQKTESNIVSKSTTRSSKPSLIGEARAKEIALGKTGGGTVVEFELDWDDGRPEYEIEIKANGYEYELEIHGYTGEILEYERDKDDDSRSSSKPAPSKPTLIGDAKAKQIALAKSGGGTVIEFELDWDDGRPEYEIEIKKDGLEYELEIDGYTGKILEYEIDD